MDAVAYPTRRQLREQEQAANRRQRRAAPPVPRPAAPVVRTSSPAYTDAASRSASAKKPARVLITMAAVAGLFASAGLPAYAFSTEAASSVASTGADATALSVSSDVTALKATRDQFTATSPADLAQMRSNSLKDANWKAYQASGARQAGDDYPWYSELSINQGGGLSPLNYFYRECVDFVAWKLNEDVGSTQAPFTFDWSYLTPSGGDAYMWKYNWEQHGWTVSTTPKKGSVAWFGGHVGYVAAVYKDGTVLIEEYNYMSDHTYGTRIIPATDVPAYLYAPPLP